MKRQLVFLAVVAAVLVMGVATVFAAEMSGQVTAVDVAKGTLTVKSEKIDVGFDCEKGSLISDVKVGDQVTVKYEEKDGKKMVSEVTVAPAKKKAIVGC